MKLSEMKMDPPKILLYGPPGGGKTALATTLGEGCKYFDLDEGLTTALKLKDIHTPDRMNIDVEALRDDNVNKPTKWAKLKSKVLSLLNEFEAKRKPCTSLVLDSLTTAGEAALRFILSNSNHLDQQPQIQEWGLAMAELEKMLLWLRSLPIPVMVLAHQEMKAIDDKNNSIELWVIGNKLAPKIPAFFSEVWYLKPKEEAGQKLSYFLQTKHTGLVLARSRANIADKIDSNLGMKKIFDLMGYKHELEVKTNG